MLQAIQTKYLGCTNTRGSRIKAWCSAGSLTIPYPHEFDGGECHRFAAVQLQAKLGWDVEHYGELKGGILPSGDYCFVMEI